MSRALRLFVCLLVLVAGNGLALAANFKTVCASGCDYTSLQSAITASGGSSSNPWTIQVQRGIYSIDASIEVDGKSYLTIEGLGMENTILQASEQWFENAGTDPNFFMILDSEHITLRNIGIDVITNSGSGFTVASADITGVFLEHANPVMIDSADISAVSWGIRDANPASNQDPAANFLEMFNSRISAQYFAGWLTGGSVWLVWSTTFRGEGDLTANTTPSIVGGMYVNGGDPAAAHNVFTAWGCHFHAESSHAGELRAVDLEQMKINDVTSIVGSTIHAKTTASTDTQVYRVSALYAQTSQGANVDVSGSEIVYEGNAEIPYGTFAGVYTAIGNMFVNLTGTSIIDRARDDSTTPATLAGATHYDIYRAIAGPLTQATVRVIGSRAVSMYASSTSAAQSLNTVELQAGSDTLVSGTRTVTLPVPLPSNKYRVVVTGSANETFYVSSKSATTFTVSSSNGSSTASVDWIVRY